MKQHEPAVRFEGRVIDAIQREMLQASGSEIGGILLGRHELGRHEGGETVVEDFEPVPCEHRFGRYYFLSDEDLRGLAESVEWFRGLSASETESGLEVLGFFRSRVRPDSSWNERDEEVMRRYFGESGSLLGLVKADPAEAFDAEIFVLDEGNLRPAGPRPAPAETRPSERPVVLPPATRPRLREPEEAPDRSWWWVAGLVALTLAGAVFGYRSVEPPPASAPVKQPATSQPQAPAAEIPDPPPTPAPAPASASASTVSPAMERGIQSAIERWQHAILSGDPDLIADCYAPQLERYFDQQNSSSGRVRQTALRSFQHFGKPAILRISDLAILPEAPDRAIATFRKHWQTRGPKVFAGEEQERLAFVQVNDGTPPLWKIISEEDTKVYWTRRPRTRGSRSR